MNEKGYKAFGKGLVCKGKQYAENTTYEEQGGEICHAGMMHYCVNPLDVLDYYPLIDDNGDLTEFAEVTSEEEPVTDDGKKFATKKLHIGAKLSFSKFVHACVDFLYEKTTKADNPASGDCSQLAASGDYSKLAASGDDSKLAASGDDSKLAASGDGSQLAASGDGSKLAASGYGSKLDLKGEESVGAAIGCNSKIRGKIGSWITLAEYGAFNGKYCPCLCVKSAKIDGVTLKEDTWYTLQNGEFTEV
jgi:hypothetical protein